MILREHSDTDLRCIKIWRNCGKKQCLLTRWVSITTVDTPQCHSSSNMDDLSVQHISQICIRMFSKTLCWLVLRWSRICGWSHNESAMILLHLYITTKVTTDICWAHMPISLHNYQSNHTHLPLRWASEEEGATIPNVVKTIWILHNSLAWFVLVCECLGWFHDFITGMYFYGSQISITMFSKNLCWLVVRWSGIFGWASQNVSAMILREHSDADLRTKNHFYWPDGSQLLQ